MLSFAALASLFCIVAVWGLYPALIGAIGVLIRRNGDPAGSRPAPLPRVTAIVATRADAMAVRERVSDLLASEYPEALLDVIVAYDARATETLPMWTGPARERVRIVRGDEPGGKASALNAG